MPEYIVRRHRAVWETEEFRATAESPEAIAAGFDALLAAAQDGGETAISSGDGVGHVADSVEVLDPAQGGPAWPRKLLAFDPDPSPPVTTEDGLDRFLQDATLHLRELWESREGPEIGEHEGRALNDILTAFFGDKAAPAGTPRRYRYTDEAGTPAAACPGCGVSWVAEDNIVLEVSVNDHLDAHDTRLGPGGELVDVDRLVANGYHSATRCGGCGAMLIDMDIVEHDD